MLKINKYIIAGIICSFVSACGGDVKESLGLNRNAPDEFKVISKPPLSIPPNFSLRPPRDKKNGVSQSTTVPEDARKLLVTSGDANISKKIKRKGVTQGESSFLSKAGTANANPDIKRLIHEDQNPQASEDSFMKKLLKEDEEKKGPDSVVDAVKESDRIKENIRNDRPVTDGETPTLDTGNQGILNKIFN